MRPASPYAAAKASAHLLCGAYRRAFGLRIACGILSIHESRRRPGSFLTRKVVDHVRFARDRAAAGSSAGQPLAVGNLAVRRDWGFAPDVVDGMIRIARQGAVRAEVSGHTSEEDVASSYRDYLLATGELHAVWEVIDRAFALAGVPVDWDRDDPDPAGWSARFTTTSEPAVVVDPSLFRRSEPAAIGGNPARARTELGWTARPGLDVFLADMLDLPSPAAVSS
jgi:GDPmannose 4,6-dehydratase